MITLLENKQLIHVGDWEKIRERPGFRDELHPGSVEFLEIIGLYHEKHPRPCGLMTCHTPHKRGYIVTVKGGEETNIGHQCGKTYFHVDFDELSRDFESRVSAYQHRVKLSEVAARSERIKHDLETLLEGPRGGRQVRRLVQMITNPSQGMPREITDIFRTASKSSGGALFTTRSETDVELELRLTREGRRDIESIDKEKERAYVEEAFHQLRGIEVLQSDNDLRTLLITEIRTPLEEFLSADIDTMSNHELGRWAAWADRLADKFKLAGQVLNSGHEFFTVQNLSPVIELIESQTARERFKQFLREMPPPAR